MYYIVNYISLFFNVKIPALSGVTYCLSSLCTPLVVHVPQSDQENIVSIRSHLACNEQVVFHGLFSLQTLIAGGSMTGLMTWAWSTPTPSSCVTKVVYGFLAAWVSDQAHLWRRPCWLSNTSLAMCSTTCTERELSEKVLLWLCILDIQLTYTSQNTMISKAINTEDCLLIRIWYWVHNDGRRQFETSNYMQLSIYNSTHLYVSYVPKYKVPPKIIWTLACAHNTLNVTRL